MCKQDTAISMIETTEDKGGMTPQQLALAKAQRDDFVDFRKEIKTEFTEVKTDVASMKAGVEALKMSIEKQQSFIANLKGIFTNKVTLLFLFAWVIKLIGVEAFQAVAAVLPNF